MSNANDLAGGIGNHREALAKHICEWLRPRAIWLATAIAGLVAAALHFPIDDTRMPVVATMTASRRA